MVCFEPEEPDWRVIFHFVHSPSEIGRALNNVQSRNFGVRDLADSPFESVGSLEGFRIFEIQGVFEDELSLPGADESNPELVIYDIV